MKNSNHKLKIAFTGLRANKLFGYGNYSAYKPLIDTLYNVSKKLLCQCPSITFCTGGAQGADMCAFTAVQQLQAEYPSLVANELYLPFPQYEAKWSASGLFSKAWLTRMQEVASSYTYVAEAYSTKAYHQRNDALLTDADYLVAVYPHRDFRADRKSGTASTMRKAYSRRIPIIWIDPFTLKCLIHK